VKPLMIFLLLATGFLARGEIAGAGDRPGEELPVEDQEIVENLDLLENLEMLPALEWLMQGDGDSETVPEESPESGLPEEPQDGEKP